MTRLTSVAVGTAFGAVLLLAVGCSPPGEDLVQAGKVTVENYSTGRGRVSDVDVYQDGQTLVVQTTLRRSVAMRRQSLGHIDLAVFAPDGTILAQKNIPDRWSHCELRRTLWVRFPLVAPPGATVRVLFHDPKAPPAKRHSAQEWQTIWEARQREPGSGSPRL